ncbi:hypothetical protein [Pseudophaeobacter sp.]|uniref:hypothetical protein n=1 Tax=Pseudophaeobacter sp. TaxID=1971739 RepID=UPI003296ABBE
MKTLTLPLAASLFAALSAAPALAHGAADIHTHPEEMMGLAALVALVVIGGYLAWKARA